MTRYYAYTGEITVYSFCSEIVYYLLSANSTGVDESGYCTGKITVYFFCSQIILVIWILKMYIHILEQME